MPPVCLHEIANFYHLADGALLRIVKTEHSAAIGPMGIQEGWLPILEKAGFHPELVRNDVCTNIAAGAWILVYVARQKKKRPLPKHQTLPVHHCSRLPYQEACVHVPLTRPISIGFLFLSFWASSLQKVVALAKLSATTMGHMIWARPRLTRPTYLNWQIRG